MKIEAKDIFGSIIAVLALITAVIQYYGKQTTQGENTLLINQQNKIIERYEKEIDRNIAIITFLDSIASDCAGAK